MRIIRYGIPYVVCCIVLPCSGYAYRPFDLFACAQCIDQWYKTNDTICTLCVGEIIMDRNDGTVINIGCQSCPDDTRLTDTSTRCEDCSLLFRQSKDDPHTCGRCK